MRLFYLYLLLPFVMMAQKEDVQLDLLPYYSDDHPLYHEVDRLSIQSDSFHNIHTGIRRIRPSQLAELYPSDYSGINYAQSVVSDKSLWNTFYKRTGQFYSINTSSFKLVFNPLFNFKAGVESESNDFIFLNKRGIELYGQLDNKLYFYTTFHETQSNFLNYQLPFIEGARTIRGANNFKDFQSGIIDDLSGFDYPFAQGYLGYHLSDHAHLELGHGKNFIGHGMRSLLLSDSGANYFFLRLGINVWKLHYQSIWAELNTSSARVSPNNDLLPKKYMASHYLSYKIGRKVEIGFFETIIFSRENQFELQYLNPVIFYRTVEFQLDSPDNVLLGFNFNWNFLNRFSVYGQILLDELNVSQLTAGNDWWGNKFGFQAGLKYIDIARVKNLDGQIEWNRVRPYTYTHHVTSEEFPQFSVTNFSHYNQPLAHPLGANFQEVIFKLRYQPHSKWLLESRFLHTRVGRDTDQNFGENITLPNTSRISDFGITQNQGALSTINMFDLNVSYEVLSALYLDFQFIQRSDSNPLLTSFDTSYIGLGFRYNVVNAQIDY